MDHQIHVNKPYAMPISPTKTQPQPKQTEPDFKRFLQDAEQLKISKHARTRMDERNIAVDDDMWSTISDKVDDARKKGVSDSLVLTKDAALLVSTKNNTVITAMERNEAASKIFTNIDGAIVIND